MDGQNDMCFSRFSRAGFAFPVCVALLIAWISPALVGTVRGQEAVRMSIASAQAAEARRRAESTVGYYNLKLGPTGWKFGTGVDVEFNDNVENQEVHREADVIFRPQLNAQMTWPLS